MRLRISDDRSTEGSLRGYAVINGVTQFDGPVAFRASRIWRAMEDVETLKYKERSGKGEIINNPMCSQTLICACNPAYVTTTGLIQGMPATQVYPVLVDKATLGLETDALQQEVTFLDRTAFEEFLEEWDDERDIAIAKAWANVSKSEIQLLASLGEMPETLSWIKSIFTRAIKLIKGIKTLNSKLVLASILYENGKVKASKKVLSTLGSKKKDVLPAVMDPWLEYRYAIRPLVFEMKSALEALKASINKGTRFTSRGFYENKTISNTYDYTDVFGSWVRAHRRLSLTHTRNYRAGVLAKIDSDINALLAIWGLDQPLQSVYELIPFSFIVDWFFNVGTIIGAWAPKASLQVLSSWIVEAHLLQRDVVITAVDPLMLEPVVWQTASIEGGNNYSWGTTIKRRLPSPDRPILPSFNLRLDMAKIADLASIGYALFLGSPSLKLAKRA